MITYTFIIGYGYVEDSRGTSAIVNYYTEEQDNAKAVVEFLKTLRGCFESNEDVELFLERFFNTTADGIGGYLGDLEVCDNINLWGFFQEGPLIRLEGLNHFFADPDEDFGRHIECCAFEEFGDMDFVTAGSEDMDVEQIYADTFKGEDVEEDMTRDIIANMFAEHAFISCLVMDVQNEGHYKVRLFYTGGMSLEPNIRFSKTGDEKTDMETIDGWVKRFVIENTPKDE